MAATPWSLRNKPELALHLRDAEERREQRKGVEIPVPKAFRITYNEIVEHRFTENCPQCKNNERHRKSKPGVSQTNACRQRLQDALMSTPPGQKRLELCEGRIDPAIADRVPDYEWLPGGTGAGRAAALGADGSGLARAAAAPAGDPAVPLYYVLELNSLHCQLLMLTVHYV